MAGTNDAGSPPQSGRFDETVVTTSDEGPTVRSSYRRRRPLPALVILLVLAILVSVVWRQVLGSHTAVVGAAACPAPRAPSASTGPTGAAAAPAGKAVDRAALAAVAPAAPRDTAVRVLNANGQLGQAGLISSELAQAQLGFVRAADNPTGNDTVYPDQNMQCVGQIRFGAAGLARARTLSLAVPCTELVQDSRADTVVDLALGTTFGTVAPSAAAQSVLTALNAAPPGTPATVNQAELSAASNASC